MTEDITTVRMDLPHGIKGSCRSNKDGSYTIILNTRYSCEEQMETYMHELEHIQHDDFHIAESADNVEYKRHKG